jgi:hypothetical protein
MPVPSQGHYGFHSFPVDDWFFLFIYLWVLTFSGWWLIFSVYILMSFDVFRLMTDFFCLYTYEFWFSLCKIARSSVILLLLLFTIRCEKYITAKTFTWLYELHGECFIRRRNCLLLVRTWDHLLFVVGTSVLLIFLVLCVVFLVCLSSFCVLWPMLPVYLWIVHTTFFLRFSPAFI